MFVLGAPEELEALVGLFGKLYVYTLDCATFYSLRVAQKSSVQEKLHDTHPSGMELKYPSSYKNVFFDVNDIQSFFDFLPSNRAMISTYNEQGCGDVAHLRQLLSNF